MGQSSGKSDFYTQLPEEMHKHLRAVFSDKIYQADARVFNRAVESWLVKRALFNRIIDHGKFTRVQEFSGKKTNGCIAITISGSLITVGPIVENYRKITYTSIGIRKDVPKVKIERKGVIENSIKVNESLKLKDSSIFSTSAVMDIGVIDNIVELPKQQAEIRRANNILLNNFLEVNQSLASEYKEPDLRSRDDLFDKWYCNDWFKVGGMEEQILRFRLKLLWLELFSGFYKFLATNDVLKTKKEGIFLDIQNKQFKKYLTETVYEIDSKKAFVNKIIELELIPGKNNFWTFIDAFLKEMEKMYS